MGKPTFAEDAWEEYLYWQKQDKRTLKRSNALLKEIQRDPFPDTVKIVLQEQVRPDTETVPGHMEEDLYALFLAAGKVPYFNHIL